MAGRCRWWLGCSVDFKECGEAFPRTVSRPAAVRALPPQELVPVMPPPTSRGWVASVVRWVRSFAPARAPGGMAGHDPPSVHRTPGRLVAFSDAVFAITVTLLVLEIRPPTHYTNLLHGLAVLWPSYLAYALTFLFIGQVWANTTSCSTTSALPTGSYCCSTRCC